MSEKTVSFTEFLAQNANRARERDQREVASQQPVAPESHRLPQQSVQLVGYSALDSEGASVDVMSVSTTSAPTTNFVCDSDTGAEVSLTPENLMFVIELDADSAEHLAQCLMSYSQAARQINTAFDGVERMNANATEN